MNVLVHSYGLHVYIEWKLVGILKQSKLHAGIFLRRMVIVVRSVNLLIGWNNPLPLFVIILMVILTIGT